MAVTNWRSAFELPWVVVSHRTFENDPHPAFGDTEDVPCFGTVAAVKSGLR
jgi:hypothetical protein